MQDGDLDDTDEDSKPIIKVKKDATSDLVVEPNVKSEDPLIAKEDKLSGIQVVSTNGSAKHNNNSDKESSEPKFTKVSSWQKVQACTLKTFNRMKRRIGFLIYQFVLPAIQVILMQTVAGSHLFTFVKNRYQIEFNALQFHIFF